MMVFHPRGDTSPAWWVLATAMGVVNVATIVGNSAVMAALWRVRRAPSHYPLTSLVLADLLVGVMVQPLAALRELFVFNLNHVICSFWITVDVLCCTASILSLCTLGWERWCGITVPLARDRRARRARLLAKLVWPVAFVIALPNVFFPSPKHFHPGEEEKACSVNTNTGYVFYSMTFSFYLPAVMLVVMYGYILRALSSPPKIRAHRGRTARVPQVPPSIGSPNRESADRNENIKIEIGETPTGRYVNIASRLACTAPTTGKCSEHENFLTRQRRASRTIVMLMALFLVCWTPYFIILPIDSLYDCIPEYAWLICSWLGYVNSALNPIVYAAASPSVRLALHSALTTSSTRRVEKELTPRLERR